MSALQLIITDAGRAALVNAANDGTNAVRIAQAGISPTAFAPTSATAVIPGETKRIATIAGEVVAADTMHMIVRDESADAFTIRSVGLYLANGTLFAVYSQAGVIVEKSAQAMMLLQMDIRFQDIAAAQVSFGDANFLNPPATTDVQGVVELATEAEAEAGSDNRRAVTPKGMLRAFGTWAAAQFADVWRASNDGAGSGLDADLLDGQHGAWYADVLARLGYAPLNRAGDTATGRLIFNSGSTGSAGISSGAVSLGEIEVRGSSTGAAMMAFHRLGVGAGYFGLDTDNQWKVGGWGAPIANLLWHGGNDGAGSGLDADLLDGQQGSWYADITARLGFTPLNRAGDTATGRMIFNSGSTGSAAIASGAVSLGEIEIRGTSTGAAMMAFHRLGVGAGYFGLDTDNQWKVGGWSSGAANMLWHGGNDGAGSGLDADLLDGQQGSYYTNVVARLGYTPLNAASYNAGDILGKLTSVDGSGSGLDADLLDGQQGSWYADVPSRLGYAPLNRAGDTATGRLIFNSGSTGNDGIGAGTGSLGEIEVRGTSTGAAMMAFHRFGVAAGYFGLDTDNQWRAGGWSSGAANLLWHGGNDGSGSGLDAYLLYGQHGSWYTDVTARLGFTPLNRAGDTANGRLIFESGATGGAGVGAQIGSLGEIEVRGASTGAAMIAFHRLGVGAGYLGLDADNQWKVGGWSLGAANLLWHGGNDGSGSGLDADLLDGRQASDFALVADFGNSLAINGFQRLPNGLILQWGRVRANYTTETVTGVTFPVAFPNTCLSAMVSGYIAAASNQQDLWPQLVGEPSTAGMTIQLQGDDQNDQRLAGFNWWALGN